MANKVTKTWANSTKRGKLHITRLKKSNNTALKYTVLFMTI